MKISVNKKMVVGASIGAAVVGTVLYFLGRGENKTTEEVPAKKKKADPIKKKKEGKKVKAKVSASNKSKKK